MEVSLEEERSEDVLLKHTHSPSSLTCICILQNHVVYLYFLSFKSSLGMHVHLSVYMACVLPWL